MKKHYYFFTLLFIAMLWGATVVSAQNLVVNPSFEITNTNCGSFAEGFRSDLNPSWDNANSNIPGDSCSSPDLFSACNPVATGMPDATSFGIGWQYSRTGTRHVGLIAYSAPFGFADNYREYIQGHTTTPLVAGKTYCVSFYVSLADGSPWAVKDLGVYFSNTQYLRNACTQGSRITVTPQLVNNCGILSDTMNWVRLQWDYTATGGEQYFVIGNFNSDGGTTKAAAGGSGFGNYFAYYFIDDVSIIENSCCYVELTPKNACVSDAPFNLTATIGVGCSSSITGTWSGTGITNATSGTFSPSVAGPGTHTITFTADCGYVATTTVAVSPCAMQVCKETNGNLTASGGVNPYSWTYFQQGGTVQITNQAQCTACGYSWNSLIGQCLNGVMPASSCTTSDTWTQFATGSTISATPPNYPIKVTDGGGGVLTISNATSLPACNADPCPTITVSVSNKTDVKCFGQNNGGATVSATGGGSSYTYTWTGGLTGATQNTLAQGNYIVTATDNNNCTGQVTVTIGQPTALSATVTVDQNEDCGQKNGKLTANPQGGTSPYTYSWTGGGNTQTYSNLGANNYTVTVTDANNCTTTAQGTVTNTSGFTATITVNQHETCGQQNGKLTANPQNGASPYTYSWTGGGNSQEYENLSEGTYSVTITDANNCKATAQATITNNAGFTVQTQVTQPTCQNPLGSATVTPNGGQTPFTYSWTNGESSASVNNLAQGQHIITVTDSNNCSVKDTITIVPNAQQPTIIISGNTAICAGQTTTLTASGGATYSWSTGETGNSITVSPNTTTTYTVTGTDASGCSAVVSSSVNVSQQVSASFTASPESGGAPLEVTLTNTSTNANSYTWNFGNGQSSTSLNPTTTYSETGEYTIVLVADNGLCKDTAYSKIVVDSFPPIVIHIPNVFTPNGDNINDGFFIETHYAKTVYVELFNRWGNLMAKLEDPIAKWDGGKAVDGVYFYKYRITDLTDKVYEGHGFFHLIRK